MLAIGDSEADTHAEVAEARIVVGNDELFSDDKTTLQLSSDSTSDGGLAALRRFIA